MKVLITGGAGFIGTAVAEALLAKNIEVRAMDISKSPLAGIEKFEGSILDRYSVSDAIEGCDAVIHLAGLLGVKKTEQMRLQCLNINIQGSINVFDACVRGRVKRILISSSSEVYGESGRDFIDEDTPLNPKSVYAASKIVAEEYLRAYGERFGLDFTIMRLFNVYGRGQITEFVIPRFVKMAQKDLPLTVYGDGRQIRSFCNVDDAADGVCRILMSDNARGEVFNIGNDTEAVSMAELARRVVKLSEKDLEIRFVNMEEAGRRSSREIYARRPDLTKARTLLGYAPNTTLDEGIRRLLADDNIPDGPFESLGFASTTR